MFTQIDTGVPCQIVRGMVEELSLTVPWMTITRERISIHAKNCFVLLRIDLRQIHEFCVEREKNRGASLLTEMEAKLVETFRKLKQGNTNYFSRLIQGLIKSLQVHVENFRIKIEFIDLAEPLLGGYELIFNELHYDNLVSNIVETRFEGEFLTNGLSIVDFRLKGASKDKLILMKHSPQQIKAMSTEDFKQLFQSESNANYLIYPFLLQANFTSMYKDVSKATYKGVRSIEFSPLTLNLSNQDIQIASAFNSLLTTVQEYSTTRKIYAAHPLRENELTSYLAALRLNNLLFRLWTIKSSKRRRKNMDLVKRLEKEYVFCYQTKIFNLMENEFESSSEKLYDASLTMVYMEGPEEKTIEEIINRCEEIEKLLHYSIILVFREETMVNCRNASYFKAKLIERKKYIKAKKERSAGIGGILRKGISKIWGSSTKEVEADIDKLMEVESATKMDKDIKDSLIKNEIKTEALFEFKFPAINICLSRNQKKLLTLDIGASIYTEQMNFQSLEGRTSFKVQRVSLIDGENKVFLELMRQESPYDDLGELASRKLSLETHQEAKILETIPMRKFYNCLELNVTYPLIKDIDTEIITYGKKVFDLNVENIHLSFNRELFAKFLYFSIDFNNVKQPQAPSSKPSNTGGNLSHFLNKTIKLDETFKNLNINIRSIVLLVSHSSKPMTVGLRMAPSLSLQKNQMDVKVKEFEVFYDEDLIDIRGLAHSKDHLLATPKFLRPFSINFCLLRGTSNRLSLDMKFSTVEVFCCDRLFDICSKIMLDFSSTKLLNTESFFDDLRRETKNTLKQPKKKPILIPRLSQGLTNRKSSVQSRRMNASRKASGSAMGNSEAMDDEFYDAFEDETDLFAHNEIKSRFDIIQNVQMLMPSQLAIIDENHKIRLTNYQGDESAALQRQPAIELAITLVLEEVVLLLYSRTDLQNIMQANFSQLRMFCDFREISLKVADITFFLKQNLLTLVMKEFTNPISSMLSIFKNTSTSMGKQNETQASHGKASECFGENKLDSSPDSNSSPEAKPYVNSAVDFSRPHDLFNFKHWLLECSENLSVEIEISNGFNLYMTQQIGQIITPGIFFACKPSITFNARCLKLMAEVKIDVYNEEVGFYEPFIEELTFDNLVSAEKMTLKMESVVNSCLLNLKPSILKNLFDYLSLYSSQKIKSSAERNSVITIKNETGVGITYLVNQSGVSRSLKPYEIVNVNLVFMPQQQESGSKLRQEQVDHSVSTASFVENKAALLKIVGRVGDDKITTSFENNKQSLSTSFFSKKKLMLEIPSFGVKYTLDLSNMTDAHIKLTEHIFLVAKLEVDNFHTVLTLRSNYSITNKLDFDVECSAYLQRSSYAKDEGMTRDLFAKKRKKSEVLSEGGDNMSAADSIDLSVNEPFKKFNFNPGVSDRPKTVAYDTTEASEKEERNILLFKFVIKSKGKKFLPLLRNFPKNYFIQVRPAQLDFYETISTEPALEMNEVKNQSMKFTRVFFEDLFRRNCSSKFSLKYSVRFVLLEIP